MNRINILPAMFVLTLIAPGICFSQSDEKNKETERIVITKKGTAGEKLNIVVDGDKITVNGKPVDNTAGADVTVRRMKIRGMDPKNWEPASTPVPGMNRQIQIAGTVAPNKAMLGVNTKENEKGAEIVSVSPGSAAEKAGLKEGDIIIEAAKQKINNPDELSKALKDKNPGDEVTIVYLRDGKEQTAVASLGKWDAPEAMAFGNGESFAFPDQNFPEMFKNMPGWDKEKNTFRYQTPAIGFFNGPKLGIKIQDNEKEDGVKIIEIENGSDAEKSGLKEGDIIKELNGEKISGTDEMIMLVRRNNGKAPLKLKVDRNGSTKNIEVVFRKKIKTADL